MALRKIMSIDSNDAVVAPQLYFQFADMNFDNQKIQLENRAIACVAKTIGGCQPKPFSNVTPNGSVMANLKAAAGVRKPSLVTRYIMLGGRDDITDLTNLRALGISHVLNLTSIVPNHFPDALIYHNIPMQDAESVNITEFAPAACSFIRHVERVKGRVMVHCIAGVSRSVTLVMMHLMAAHHLRLRHAYEFVESVRSFIQPNEGFKLQLALFEVALYKSSSIAQNKPNRPGYHKAWDFYGWNSIKGDIAAGDLSSSNANFSSSNVNSACNSRRNSASGGVDISDFTPPSGRSDHRGRRKSRSSKAPELPISEGGNPGKLSPVVSPRTPLPTWIVSSQVGPSKTGGGGGIAIVEEKSGDVRDRGNSLSIGNIETIDSPLGKYNSRSQSQSSIKGTIPGILMPPPHNRKPVHSQ